MSNDTGRIKVLMYQYFLFKSDSLMDDIKFYKSKVLNSSCFSPHVFLLYLQALLKYQVFNEIYDDFVRLFNLY